MTLMAMTFLALASMTPSVAAETCVKGVCLPTPYTDPNDPNSCGGDVIVGCHYAQECDGPNDPGEPCDAYYARICLLWVPGAGCFLDGGEVYCSSDYRYCHA